MESPNEKESNVTIAMVIQGPQTKTEQINVSLKECNSSEVSKKSSEKSKNSEKNKSFLNKISDMVTTEKSSEKVPEKNSCEMNRKRFIEGANKSVKDVTKSSSGITNTSAIKKSSEELAIKQSEVVAECSQHTVIKSSIEKKLYPVTEMKITESIMSCVKKTNSSDFNTQTGLILGLLIVLAAAVWYGIQNGRVKAFLTPVRRRFQQTEGSSTYDDTAPTRYHDTLPFDGEPYDSTRPAE